MSDEAVYPGSFDPLTLGHLDVVKRASSIFSKVTLAVVDKPADRSLFTTEERVAMAKSSVEGLDNVEVASFGGLLVDYVRAHDVHVVIRGIRAYADFEYEFQMALTNRRIAPEVETLFMMPREETSYVSSSIVREILNAGGDTSMFVPDPVEAALEELRRRSS